MTLIRNYQPQTRIGMYELDGLLNVLDRIISEHGENGEADTPYYVGAFEALHIIRHAEFVDAQDDFMRLFERALDELENE